MEQIRLKFTGATALVMHNVRLSDSFNSYNKALKKLTSVDKKSKTETWEAQVARVEWEGGLYIHDSKVQLPARVIKGTLINGGKKNKKGQQFINGVEVPEHTRLIYPGEQLYLPIAPKDENHIPSPALDPFFTEEHMWRTSVVNPGSIKKTRVMRTRPIFYKWEVVFTALLDSEVLNKDDFVLGCESAGKMVGFCERTSPEKFGRFTVEVLRK